MISSFEMLLIVLFLLPGFITQGITTALTTRYPRSKLTYILSAIGWSVFLYAITWAVFAAYDGVF